MCVREPVRLSEVLSMGYSLRFFSTGEARKIEH